MPLSSWDISQPSVEAHLCRTSHDHSMVQMGTHLTRRHHAHAHAHAGGLQHSNIRMGLYQQPESALAWQLEAGTAMVRQAQGWPLLLSS